MKERESPLPLEARLVLDYRHETRGLWRDGAVFRIRIFSRGTQPPIIIATEVPENTNVSVTNFAEILAAEVIAEHLPQRFEEDEPAVWLEHYPLRPERQRDKFEFDQVTFDSWTPRAKYLGGIQRVSLGEPSWRPMRLERLAALVGPETAHALAEERQEETRTG